MSPIGVMPIFRRWVIRSKNSTASLAIEISQFLLWNPREKGINLNVSKKAQHEHLFFEIASRICNHQKTLHKFSETFPFLHDCCRGHKH